MVLVATGEPTDDRATSPDCSPAPGRPCRSWTTSRPMPSLLASSRPGAQESRVPVALDRRRSDLRTALYASQGPSGSPPRGTRVPRAVPQRSLVLDTRQGGGAGMTTFRQALVVRTLSTPHEGHRPGRGTGNRTDQGKQWLDSRRSSAPPLELVNAGRRGCHGATRICWTKDLDLDFAVTLSGDCGTGPVSLAATDANADVGIHSLQTRYQPSSYLAAPRRGGGYRPIAVMKMPRSGRTWLS